ncbi:hypothetical protein HHI36_009822 [Cryptolaemus montrouzieri]|uniref:Uncharacterized protein n=1 Tax=Cryptolaemus montrouzieri TaxID=559131 RepID=A0ABD2MGW1_9CUCU
MGAYSGPHFLRTVGGISSRPTAFFQFSCSRARLTVRTLNLISAMKEFVSGMFGGIALDESSTEFSENTRAKRSALSFRDDAILPSSLTRGGNADLQKLALTVFAIDHNCLVPLACSSSLLVTPSLTLAFALVVVRLHTFRIRTKVVPVSSVGFILLDL